MMPRTGNSSRNLISLTISLLTSEIEEILLKMHILTANQKKIAERGDVEYLQKMFNYVQHLGSILMKENCAQKQLTVNIPINQIFNQTFNSTIAGNTGSNINTNAEQTFSNRMENKTSLTSLFYFLLLCLVAASIIGIYSSGFSPIRNKNKDVTMEKSNTTMDSSPPCYPDDAPDKNALDFTTVVISIIMNFAFPNLTDRVYRMVIDIAIFIVTIILFVTTLTLRILAGEKCSRPEMAKILAVPLAEFFIISFILLIEMIVWCRNQKLVNTQNSTNTVNKD